MKQQVEGEKAHATNIETVARLESEDEERLTPTDRISEAIGGFAGTNLFILGQLMFVGSWIFINTGALAAMPPFDPHPFSLLSVVCPFRVCCSLPSY